MEAAGYKEKTSHVRCWPGVTYYKEGLTMHCTAVIAAMGAAKSTKFMFLYLSMSHDTYTASVLSSNQHWVNSVTVKVSSSMLTQ